MIPINDVAFNLKIMVLGRELVEAAASGLVSYGTSRASEIQEAIIAAANIFEGEWHVLKNGTLVTGFVPKLRLREAEINLGKDAPGLLALFLSVAGEGASDNRPPLQLRFKDGDMEEISNKRGGGFFLRRLFCRCLRHVALYEHQFGKD